MKRNKKKVQKIAVITSKYNQNITEKLEKKALSVLKKYSSLSIQTFKVPGAYEIPLAIEWAFKKGFMGALALGAIIEGETSNATLLQSHIEKSLTQIQLKYQKPIGFSVLTVKNKKLALDRSGGKKGNKGEEAALALIEMLELRKKIFSASLLEK